MTTRRELLECLGALGLSGGLAPLLEAQPQAGTPTFNRAAFEFWAQSLGQPGRHYALTGQVAAGRGERPTPDPAFLYYSPQSGFTMAEVDQTTDTATMAAASQGIADKGDANVVIAIECIRPSGGDLQAIQRNRNSNFRFDFCQADNGKGKASNWSAIATMANPPVGSFSYDDIAFDPKSTWGSAKPLPLPGGFGFWAWNFSTQSQPGMFSRLAGALFKSVGGMKDSGGVVNGKGKASNGIGRFLLGIGFPGISTVAWESINTLFGTMLAQGTTEKSEQPIIQSQQRAIVTSRAALEQQAGLMTVLRSGTYVILPSGDAAARSALLSNQYKMVTGGYLAGKDVKDTDVEAVADAQKTVLPGLTYLTASVRVSAAAAGA